MTDDEKLAHYLCIGCPLGCRLEVEEIDDDIIVRGFTCKRGKLYGRQEHTDPRRMVTTTVAVDGGRWQRLPVKTLEAVPKALLRDVCAALRSIEVIAPVEMGQLIAENVLDTGVDVVAARDLPTALAE